MNSNQEQPKKCFCAQCFMPIDEEDKICVGGQNFHKICCLCCVCRTIPTSIKMFYGHVFCSDCFKNQVMTRFRGENPRVQCSNWWMQWGPGGQDAEKKSKPAPDNNATEGPVKKVICSRCLQAVDEESKVEIAGQSFHAECAKCYCCHIVPKDRVKIYYGQLFCEECFNRHVLPRNRDNPSEFFRFCFEQWQNNTRFSEDMNNFMGSSSGAVPIIYMGQGGRPSCRCGAPNQDWFQKNESKNSTGPAQSETIKPNQDRLKRTGAETQIAYMKESANLENFTVATKIKKLTKLVQEKSSRKRSKKWQNFIEHKDGRMSLEPSLYGWVDLQKHTRASSSDCPKCLWQCGPVYVSCDYLKHAVTNCVEYTT